jgi:3-deoxy-D-manno-octulosonate 8-phosphate phosphatase (KDO 8-P phosphatase)
MPKLSAQARARKIKLLLFDVDGVLTDGKLYFVPEDAHEDAHEDAKEESKEASFEDSPRAPGSTPSRTAHEQIEIKGFHAHDGVASSLSRIAGIKSGLITRRVSETVARRARDLRLDHIHQGIQDKRACFEQVARQEGLKLEEAAFIGDDVVDLPAMRAAGFAIAVQNARAEVKREAHYITPHAGGDGALRDAVDFILKSQGRLKRTLEVYIGEHSSARKPD